MIERLKWYARQLLPLEYRTTYRVNGEVRVCQWCMWFGVSYNVLDQPLSKCAMTEAGDGRWIPSRPLPLPFGRRVKDGLRALRT